MASCLIGSCAASTPGSAQLTVFASVPPTRYIIVSSDGHMQQILSNTAEAVPPKVFEGSINADKAKPLTPTVWAAYQAMLAVHPNFAIGSLEFHSASAQGTPKPTVWEHYAAILRVVSLLMYKT
jgi:hypothetical protein